MSDPLRNRPTSMAQPNYRAFQYLHTLEGGVVQNDHPTAFPFALTPDSQRLITVELNETLKIWDLRTGFVNALPSNAPNSSNICADKVFISPDGKRCYLTYNSYKYDESGVWIKVQDISTGQILEHFKSKLSYADELVINADETLLVLGAGLGSAAVEVWDLQAKRPLYCHQLSSLISVNFSPDGQLLLMRDYDGLKVCESQTGHVLYTLDRGYYGLHMSSDSETCLALANGSDLIRQWNLKTGEMIQSWPLPKLSYDDRARLFSPDGRVLCSTPSDNHRLLGVSDYSEKIKEEDIKLWDWRTGELLSAVPVNIHSEGEPWLEGVIPHKLDQGRHLRHGHQIYEVQFTPDGRFIVTSGGDYTIRVWGSPASDPTIQFRYPEPDIGKRIKKLREWAISRAWMGNFE